MNGTLGATTPSTVAATTISASSTATFAAGAAGTPSITTTGDTNTGLFFPAADTVAVATGGTEVARFDSAGNLGLGVTPSAWASAYKVLDVGTTGSVYYDSSGVAVSNNAFINSSFSYRYKTTSYASRYEQTSAGQHQWFTAASGTAGNAITWTQAMTLDASGLLVGTTTARNRLTVVSGAGSNPPALGTNGGVTYVGGDGVLYGLLTGVSTSGYSWMQAQRVDGTATAYDIVMQSAGGNLLVGTTTNVFGGRLEIVATGNMPGGGVKNDNSAQPTLGVWNAATTGDNVFTRFLTEAGGTARGTITYNRAGGLVAYNTMSDYRAKDIYGSITDSGALIDSTPVYMGKMKGATQERPMFIAHETPAYAHSGEKDAVDKDGNPVYQQMDASALVPVMWAEIQSLRKRLAALESA
jgi:hypothetical protein